MELIRIDSERSSTLLGRVEASESSVSSGPDKQKGQMKSRGNI